METNVLKRDKQAIVPAGIFEGTEAFWLNNEKWVLHNGKVQRFVDAPGKIQRMIAEAFLNDTRSRAYLRKTGITQFRQAFDMWYKCVVGGLDYVPDFVYDTGIKMNPDAFNNTCAESCIHRGKFCSCKAALKNYEVDTILALKLGQTIEETAKMLYVSVPGLKSRIEKIKEKLGASNMASLIAKASALGI